MQSEEKSGVRRIEATEQAEQTQALKTCEVEHTEQTYTEQAKQIKHSNMKEFMQKVIIISLSAIGVVFISLCLINYNITLTILNNIKSTISPIIVGLALAYLVNFIYIRILRIEKKIFKHKRSELSDTVMNYTAIVLSETMVLLLIAVVLLAILPSLFDNITNIIESLPETLKNTENYLMNIVNNNEILKETIGKHLDLIQEKLAHFITHDLEYDTQYFMTKAVDIVGSTFKGTLNMIVSIVLNIMILANKETMLNNSKKVIKATTGKYSEFVFEELSIANDKFSGFFVGKIVDSLIIGIIAFIGSLILKLEYAPLIAVIIGITNIVPIIGPFIGAIPCAIIVLGQSVELTLYFIIFIFILQQIDGNIIGPKCIGNSTNINSFWILVALIIFGKLFGLIGMIIGVPLMAIIQDIFTKFIEYRIKKVEKEQ